MKRRAVSRLAMNDMPLRAYLHDRQRTLTNRASAIRGEIERAESELEQTKEIMALLARQALGGG